MRREVEINIPMFIGIILIVAIVTAILVYIVNFAVGTMKQDNHRMDESFNQINEYFEIQIWKFSVNNYIETIYNANTRK